VKVAGKALALETLIFAAGTLT